VRASLVKMLQGTPCASRRARYWSSVIPFACARRCSVACTVASSMRIPSSLAFCTWIRSSTIWFSTCARNWSAGGTGAFCCCRRRAIRPARWSSSRPVITSLLTTATTSSASCAPCEPSACAAAGAAASSAADAARLDTTAAKRRVFFIATETPLKSC